MRKAIANVVAVVVEGSRSTSPATGRRYPLLWLSVLSLCSMMLVITPRPAQAASPTYTVNNFTAQGWGGVSPGDPTLAVGPVYVVETINTSMTVYTKSGVQTTHLEFGTLFAPATNVFCPDPRVVYWSWDDRYAIVCTDIGSNQTIRLAITATNDPNGSWLTWTTGANTAVDQPKVEVTSDKLVIGGNPSAGSVFYVFQKSDLLAGVATPRMTSLSTPRGQYQAVVQFTAASDAYFVQAYPANDLFVADISGTPATSVGLQVTDLGPYPLASPHDPKVPGGSIGRGYIDGRIQNAVYEVTTGGAKVIQYSGMAECGTRTCNANGRITLTSTGPVSSYVKTFSELSYDDSYGAVTLDAKGRAFEVYSRSNATHTPQAAIVGSAFRTIAAKSVPGTTSCHTGVTPPCAERWGDYMGATQDPSNHEEVWFVGLYQTASGDDGWTTVISSVTVSG